MTTRTLLAALVGLLIATVGAASAHAADRFVIRGAGWGHGVGMSQFGALGFAQHGSDYRSILRHYYSGTQIGRASGRQVRVLLQSRGTAQFTGATRAGNRRLRADRTYGARRAAPGVVALVSARGRRLATYPELLRVTGPGPLTLKGKAGNGRDNGRYRGALEFRPGPLVGVNAINAVPLDHYVMGVVPRESPASWPIEALKAQSVAARTYAITTSKGGAGYDQFADTRSQVYGGFDGEAATTNEAVRQTRGEVVTHGGVPVVTYFFSTSGGRTEDVENTSLGDEPKPWLKSVEDPYDSVSPRHRWGPVRMSLGTARKKLGDLVKGSFRGIDVLRRGSSPRVVTAEVVGSEGRTRVNGATLRARLDLFDTWAFFTTISTEREEPQPSEEAGTVVGTPEGGAAPAGFAARVPARAVLAGRVLPARRGAAVTLEQRIGSAWMPVGDATVRRGGRYRAAVSAAGVYRISYRGASGAAVHVR